MTPDTLTRTLDDFEEQHPELLTEPQPIKWQTSIPSKSRPGLIYTVTAFEDGHYDCDCPGRQFQKKCCHIKGAVMMLEGKEVFKEPKPETKRLIALKEYITGRRQHRNSLISWHDEEFQALLPESQHDVLDAILRFPGMTRQQLVNVVGKPINAICPRVRELMDMELVAEDGAKQGPSGMPQARLYPTEFIVREMIVKENSKES